MIFCLHCGVACQIINLCRWLRGCVSSILVYIWSELKLDSFHDNWNFDLITQFSSGPNKGRNPHLPVRFLPQLPEVSRMILSFEVINQVLFTSEQPKKNKMAFVGILSQIKFLFGPLVIRSACVVYTKTIIHLSVGENGGYLPPLRWIIVNYVHVYCVRSYYVPVN